MTSAEQVKARLDVVTVLQGYLKLDKAGANYKARCPFHSEKSPSFFVSPSRDIWHCFGCGKGGDIFEFVMQMDGVEFSTALRTLAERAGIELNPQDREERSEKSKLLALLEEATLFFESNLKSYSAGLEYLRDRGLTSETIKEYRLGFAPDSWRALGDYLKRKGYADTEIEKCGLAIQGNRGPYDRFRSRIVFPLTDALSRPVGFAGRIFTSSVEMQGKEDQGAKYINTPQTVLYDKSRFLYGFDKAKNEIRHEKSVVVVEGNIDLILSQQAGIKNTVAVSGTALTESHIVSLRRIADSVVFAFDVDSAGVDATRRALEIAYTHDFHVRVVDIEGGKDPADIVAKNPELWRTMVKDAVDSIAFFLKKSIGESSALDPFAKKRVGETILPLVARLSNEIERAHWVRELGRVLKIGEDALWRELGKYKTKNAQAPEAQIPTTEVVAPVPISRKGRLEERIVGLLLLEPKLAMLGDLPVKAECSLAVTGEIFEYLTKRLSSGTVNEILAELPEDLRREASRFLFEAEVFTVEDGTREEEFLNVLHAWRELSLKEKLARLHEEIERLELVGKKEESRAHMEEFHKLTVHLSNIVTLHSYYNDQKNKKENRS
ncbi:MAG: DNA primase [Patescibacteria group bacterium]